MTQKKSIYLDNNATTPLDPRVLKEMYHDWHMVPANPSSVHHFGQKAKNALTSARDQIASYLKVKPQEIVFTSGGTEGINLALRGLIGNQPGSIITSEVEHSAVYETVKALCKKGHKAVYIPCGSWGAPLLEQIESAITPQTKMIALSWVNSETGVKNDIEGIAEIAERSSIPFVVDGVSLMGKEEFEIPKGVTAISFSAHKFHGPKGIGFLYLSSNCTVEPLITGGPQEFSKRAGTENFEGILGLAKAVHLLREELPHKSHQMQDLRDHLEQTLIKHIPNVSINGEGPRIANVSNLYFEGIDGEDLLLHLDLAGIAASHGSACASGSLEPSRVLLNMGYSPKRAKSSLRFSLSRFTTKEEIDTAVSIVIDLVCKLRKLS
jgi:cysteine desulfurase